MTELEQAYSTINALQCVAVARKRKIDRLTRRLEAARQEIRTLEEEVAIKVERERDEESRRRMAEWYWALSQSTKALQVSVANQIALASGDWGRPSRG